MCSCTTSEEVLTDDVPDTFTAKWDAYPALPPTSTFPPVQLAPGLYYVNAFEP